MSEDSPGIALDPRGKPYRRWRVQLQVGARKVLGTLLALNFAAVWAAPVIVQGQIFRRGLDRTVRSVYGLVDGSTALRRFAARFVYLRPAHLDYFAAAVILISSTCVLLGALFAWQIAFGRLPWWLVVLYYFVWVGPGGRGMATAWTLAHREGHLSGGRMYRPWLGSRAWLSFGGSRAFTHRWIAREQGCAAVWRSTGSGCRPAFSRC